MNNLNEEPLSSTACVLAVCVLLIGVAVVTYVACKNLPGPPGPDQPEPPVWQTNIITLGTNHIVVTRSNHIIVATQPLSLFRAAREFLARPMSLGVSLCQSNAIGADLYCRFSIVLATNLAGPWQTNVIHCWRTTNGILFQRQGAPGGNYARLELDSPTNGFIRIEP